MKLNFIKIAVASVMLAIGTLAANAQPGGQFGGQFDPAQMTKMRVDRMKESLKLNDDQCKKLTDLFTKEQEEMMKMFQSGGQGQMPDMEAMQKRRDAQNAELKKILTEEQYKAYEEQQKQMMSRMGQGGQGGPRGGQGGPRGGQGGPGAPRR